MTNYAEALRSISTGGDPDKEVIPDTSTQTSQPSMSAPESSPGRRLGYPDLSMPAKITTQYRPGYINEGSSSAAHPGPYPP
jgi:hypothetical protein